MTEVNIQSTDILDSFGATKTSLDAKYEAILSKISDVIDTIIITADNKQTQACVKAILDSESLIFKLRALLMEERFKLNKVLASTDSSGVAKLLSGQIKLRLKDITDLNTRLSELSADAEQVQRAWYSWNYKTF